MCTDILAQDCAQLPCSSPFDRSLLVNKCGIPDKRVPARPSCQISAKTPTSFLTLNGHPSVWYFGN